MIIMAKKRKEKGEKVDFFGILDVVDLFLELIPGKAATLMLIIGVIGGGYFGYQYGLAAGVFTENNGIALRVSKAVRAGIVFVNTYRLISPIAPFGGFKNSGFGRESGMEAIKDYSNIKTTWINTATEPMGDPFIIR